MRGRKAVRSDRRVVFASFAGGAAFASAPGARVIGSHLRVAHQLREARRSRFASRPRRMCRSHVALERPASCLPSDGSQLRRHRRVSRAPSRQRRGRAPLRRAERRERVLSWRSDRHVRRRRAEHDALFPRRAMRPNDARERSRHPGLLFAVLRRRTTHALRARSDRLVWTGHARRAHAVSHRIALRRSAPARWRRRGHVRAPPLRARSRSLRRDASRSLRGRGGRSRRPRRDRLCSRWSHVPRLRHQRELRSWRDLRSRARALRRRRAAIVRGRRVGVGTLRKMGPRPVSSAR